MGHRAFYPRVCPRQVFFILLQSAMVFDIIKTWSNRQQVALDNLMWEMQIGFYFNLVLFNFRGQLYFFFLAPID